MNYLHFIIIILIILIVLILMIQKSCMFNENKEQYNTTNSITETVNALLQDADEKNRVRQLLNTPDNTPFVNQVSWCAQPQQRCNPGIGVFVEYQKSENRINVYGTLNPNHVGEPSKVNPVFEYYGKNTTLKQVNYLDFDKLPLINKNGDFSEISFPDGMITPFIGQLSDIDDLNGWVLCDGTKGTPDLRGRFVRMATLGHRPNGVLEHNFNERGGSDLTKAEVENLPPHKHRLYDYWFNQGVAENGQPYDANIGRKKIAVRNPNDITLKNAHRLPYGLPGSMGNGSKQSFTGTYSVKTNNYGKSSNDISPEDNQPPYSTVFFIMKKTNREKLRYGSTINIKTESGLFLNVDQTKPLSISYNALPSLHTHAFTIERAPVKDRPGSTHNETEEFVKYGEPVYIKSKSTNNFLYRVNDKLIKGIGDGNNSGAYWDSQAFKIDSWDSNKNGYVELGDEVLIKSFSASQGNSCFYVSIDSTKGNMQYLYPFGSGDRRHYSQKFTLNPIKRVMTITENSVTNHNTPFNDECGGKIICLDRHNVQCPEGTSLTQLNITRNGKGKYRYNYKCRQTPYISKKEKDKINPAAGTEDKGWLYMGRKAIHRDQSDIGFSNSFHNNEYGAGDNCNRNPDCGGFMKGPNGTYWGKKQSVVDDYMLNNKNKHWDSDQGTNWHFG